MNPIITYIEERIKMYKDDPYWNQEYFREDMAEELQAVLNKIKETS